MSSPNHKRGPEGTVQRRVFLCIVAGARSRAEIAAAARITPDAASKACYYLKLARLVGGDDARQARRIMAAAGAAYPGRRHHLGAMLAVAGRRRRKARSARSGYVGASGGVKTP